MNKKKDASLVFDFSTKMPEKRQFQEDVGGGGGGGGEGGGFVSGVSGQLERSSETQVFFFLA